MGSKSFTISPKPQFVPLLSTGDPVFVLAFVAIVFSFAGNVNATELNVSNLEIEIEDRIIGCKIKTSELETDCRYLDDGQRSDPELPAEFIGVAEDDPEYPHDSQLTFDNNGTLVAASGLGVSLFYDLAHAIKFRPIFLKGTGWGEKLPNGSWEGMPVQVLDPQHDALDNILCISSSTMTLDRVTEFTYLQPSYTTHYFVHFRPPPSRAFRIVFLQPFKTGVWQSILVVSVISAITLKIFYCFNDGLLNTDDGDENSSSIRAIVGSRGLLKAKSKLTCKTEDFSDGSKFSDSGSFSDLFFWIVSNICQKGWSPRPRSDSMRILFFCFILSTTVLYVAYSAVLVSIFSTDENLVITDLSQLASKHITVYGDEEIPFIFQVIQASTSTSTSTEATQDNSTSTSQSDLPHKNGMKLSDAVHKVLTSSSAIVTVEGFYNEFRRQNFTVNDYCGNISTIRILQQKRQAGMYVRRQWKYREVFSKTIIQIIERGLSFRYNRIFDDVSRPHCGQASHTKTTLEDIKFENTFPALVMLVIGFGISLGTLFLECLIHKQGCLGQQWNLSIVRNFLRP